MPVATQHYHGHRQRLRQRFLSEEPLADYELLELLLFQGSPRRDVKPLAKILLVKFTSLSRVLSAKEKDLKELGINPASILTLKLAYSLHSHILENAAFCRDKKLDSLEDIVTFCHHKLAPLTEEVFYTIYLDSQGGVLRNEISQKGTANQVAIYPREIVKTALNSGATNLILAHNHPGGNPTPSFEDLKLTHELQNICKPLDIRVLDHIIVGHLETVSLKETGKLREL